MLVPFYLKMTTLDRSEGFCTGQNICVAVILSVGSL